MSKKLLENYKKNGFLLHRLQKTQILKKLRKRFLSIFNETSKINLKKKIKNDAHVIDLYNSKNKKLWTGVYDIIKQDPLVYELASSKELLNLAKNLGLKNPTFGTRPQVRVDMPNDSKFSFKSHQDHPFNLGSKNSITIWIPLQNVTKKNGTLQISKQSHKGEKIYLYGWGNKFNIDIAKNIKNKISNNDHYKLSLNDNKFNFEDIEMKVGQALVFSQFLVHKSGQNKSDSIRFSVQLRYTDLADKEYAKNNYFLFSR